MIARKSLHMAAAVLVLWSTCFVVGEARADTIKAVLFTGFLASSGSTGMDTLNMTLENRFGNASQPDAILPG